MAKQRLDLKKLKGFKGRSVSIRHLPELQEDIEKHKRQNLLDKHLAEVYLKFDYDVLAALPGAQSLIIVAVPQPVMRASFIWQGKVCHGDVPPTYIGKVDDARVKDALTQIVGPAGFKVVRGRLPVKTLAVRSGLAQYGRNNITYVPGFGSFHRLVAFATDGLFQEDSWGELTMMKACETCFKCGDNCPTHCIPTDRFLVHAENCLTWHNEQADALANWIKPDWHNALIGCMRCQLICPVNKKQLNNVVPGPVFSEEETGLLLQKLPLASLPEETQRKLAEIAMDDSYEVLGRNLDALIKSQSL
ncbi:MAG: 4Fe-4S double cluster binding domain-containing protein [Dehalococcoidales bacterium]